VEVFHSVVGGTGKELAKKIHDEIVALGQNSRGVKTRKEDNGSDWYGFIRETKAPAVIVEYAFLDNDKDVQFVDTEAEQKANGVATAKGILKQLGIAYVPETEEADKQIVLGEFKTLREADDYLGALLAKLDYAMAQADLAKLAAADVKNELLKAKVVG
jgi:N-acetylmuramoyl-L-alanine amidase